MYVSVCVASSPHELQIIRLTASAIKLIEGDTSYNNKHNY